jgi:hypothetical protein
MPIAEIMVTYMADDNCIPLTAFYRLLLDASLNLSEMALRLPVIVAGLLFLALAPWVTRRLLGKQAALVMAGLVAIYPAFVFYSRFARSYMPMLLFAFAAAASFYFWWVSGRRRWAVGYAVCAPLAMYFHLGAGPLLAVPFVWAAALKLWRLTRRGAEGIQRGWTELFVVGLGATAGVASFLLPARHSLLQLMDLKRIEQRLPTSEVAEVLVLQSGSPNLSLVVLFWALAVLGLWILWRRRRDLAGFTLALVVGHAAGLLVLSPYGLNHPLVVNRYLLPATPFVLLWVVSGVTAPWRSLEREPSRGWAAKAVGVGVVVWLVSMLATGPFVEPGFLVGSFAHHTDAIWFTRAPNYIEDHAPPAVYDWLRDEAPPGPVVEYPWFSFWSYNRTFALYQLIHRREVVVAAIESDFWHERLGFRNMVGPHPERLLGSRARYVLVHRDMAAEEDRVVIPEPSTRHTRLPRRARRVLDARKGLIGLLNRGWGSPVYSDPQVAVWDLDAIRSRRSP